VATALLLVLATSAANAASASIYYTYDSNGRVITALYSNGTCVVYAYDPTGNRTSQTNTTNGTPESPNWGSGMWGCFVWTAQEVKLSKPADRFATRATTPRGAGR
jgi:YD repeat-containing protein